MEVRVIELNLLQLLLNSIVTANIYLLATLGFAFVYSLERFSNIAHVQFFTFGAYMGIVSANMLGFSLPYSLLLAFIGSGLLGLLSSFCVFRPLKRRGATPVHLIVASVGYGLALMYFIQEIWGRDIQIYNYVFYPFTFGPVRLTWLWIYTIIVGCVTTLALHLLLTRLKIGKAIRAISFNPSLAMASGIDIRKIEAFVWFIGAGLAGIGGVFQGINVRVIPILGFELFIIVIAVAVLGGLGNFYGVLTASYLMGLAENFSIPLLLAVRLPTDLRVVVAYAMVIAALLYMSAGKPLRISWRH